VPALFIAAVIAGATPPAMPAEPVPPAVVKFQGEDLALYAPGQIQPTRTAKPDYPFPEQANRVERHVLLVAIVGFNGHVIESQIAESKPTARFGEAAKACIKKWRFPPMKRNGAPTKYAVTVPFEFLLR
jgi:protein TonB